MSARGDDTGSRSALGRFGDWLESLMFGERSRAYTWFVRIVVAAFLALALVSLFTETFPAVDTLTGIVFALFVLTALLQVIALARRFQRGQEAVAESADALEETADEVAEAADQVAALSDEVAKGGGSNAETVERAAGDAKKQAEHAKGTADAVKEGVAGARGEGAKAKRTERDAQSERSDRDEPPERDERREG